MKIGVFNIMRAHVRTLRNIQTDRLDFADLLIFFLIPLTIGIASYYFGVVTQKDFDNLSITFLGIFIALLLNIQVALFSIFQRNWKENNDDILQEIQNDKIDQRGLLLSELNTNISYLIALSTLALIAFILLYVLDRHTIVITFVIFVFYSHFLMTLLMVVKRTYALFQGEYHFGMK